MDFEYDEPTESETIPTIKETQGSFVSIVSWICKVFRCCYTIVITILCLSGIILNKTFYLRNRSLYTLLVLGPIIQVGLNNFNPEKRSFRTKDLHLLLQSLMAWLAFPLLYGFIQVPQLTILWNLYGCVNCAVDYNSTKFLGVKTIIAFKKIVIVLTSILELRVIHIYNNYTQNLNPNYKEEFFTFPGTQIFFQSTILATMSITICILLFRHTQRNMVPRMTRKTSDSIPNKKLMAFIVFFVVLVFILQTCTIFDEFERVLGYITRREKMFDLWKPIQPPYEKIRVGRDTDGGYLIQPVGLTKDKILLSYGINDDISFETVFADKGMEVYMWDHTISHLPNNTEHPRLHWFKQPGSAFTFEDQILLYSKNLTKNNLFLKMDIESGEFPILLHCPPHYLKVFDQIVIEIHMIRFPNQGQLNAVYNLMKYFELTHIHINNCCNSEGEFDVVELSLLRKDLVPTPIKFDSTKHYPHPLDTKNVPNFVDDVFPDWW
jgi:hypothetical protein